MLSLSEPRLGIIFFKVSMWFSVTWSNCWGWQHSRACASPTAVHVAAAEVAVVVVLVVAVTGIESKIMVTQCGGA